MKTIRFLILLVFTALQTISAQQRTITGYVKDAKSGKVITGATVTQKGTTNKAVTDNNGLFRLSIQGSVKTISISSINYITQDVNVANTNSVEVLLTEQENVLQEVVVTGYGNQRRADIAGTITSVKGKEIANLPVQSFEQSLAGRAAGVQITIPSGVLNAPPVFRIRGTNSISLSSQPLIIVDGVPVQTGNAGAFGAAANVLGNINPNDIESIDIAKDASASAIYGSRAANGVVFITTKKGKVGAPKVNFDSWIGFSEPMRLPPLLDAFQYTDFKNKAIQNALNIRANGVNPLNTRFALSNDANGNVINTNWYDVVYRKGVSQSNSINVSGGNENTTYYLSAGYTNQEGIIQKNNYKRFNTVLNIDTRIAKWMSMGGKLSYSIEKNEAALVSGSLLGEAFATAGAGRLAIVSAPNVSPYLNNGAYNIGTQFLGPMNNILLNNQAGFHNPQVLIDLNRENTDIDHIQSNTYLQIKPLSGLTFKTIYGIDRILTDNDRFRNPIHGDAQSVGGQAQSVYGTFNRSIWTNTFQFDQMFGDHSLGILIGNEQQRTTSRRYGIDRQTLSDPAFNVVQAGFITNNSLGNVLGENYLLSNFARLNYNYKRKYIVSINARQDEYSALNVKKGTFWGISASWDVTREKFWEKTKLNQVFSSLKLKSSYGKVGNINGVGDFDGYPLFSTGLYGGLPTLAFAQSSDPGLSWETSKKFDAGISLGFFNDRLTAEIDYYRNNINGLLLEVPQAPSAGLPIPGTAAGVLQNVGSMYNRGLELAINAQIIQKRNFNWTSSFNIALNENKVTQLAPGLSEILFLTGSTSGIGTTGENANRTTPGFSAGYLWVVRSGGVDPATGRRIFYNAAGRAVTYQHITPFVSGTSGPTQGNWKYLDNGADAPAITQANDAVMYANVVPKYVGGWSNNFQIRNFDLNVLMTYQLGFSIYYGTNAGLHDQRFWNNATTILNHWTKQGDRAEYPMPVFGDNVSNGSTIPMDINVFRGDFLKLKTLTLGYTLPKSLTNRISLSSLRFYLSGQNLLVITKYPGPDPEVSTNSTVSNAQGADRNTVVNGRTITVGLNIGF